MARAQQACTLIAVLVFLLAAGQLGTLPGTRQVAASGIATFDAEEAADVPSVPAGQGAAASGDSSTTTWVNVGPGLPALPKKLVQRIKANEFVDFAEFPPAKGKSRPLPQAFEGQAIVVQAADLVNTRKSIQDLAVWSQCFALYVAVLAADQPGRLGDLMAYQSLIAKVSRKYRWPSWVVYDHNFRQEAAGNPSQAWAKADPSLYTQCFTNQAVSGESWCSRCQGVDHSTANCPMNPRGVKRPWSTTSQGRQPVSAAKREQIICEKYNRFAGDCHFGKECKYQHVCSRCKEPHPVSRCSKASSGTQEK